jgi:NTE family protein
VGVRPAPGERHTRGRAAAFLAGPARLRRRAGQPVAEPPEQDLLCFAVELFSLRHHRPTTLNAVLARAQDISFASHARRSVDALRREYGLRRQLDPNSASITLAHLAYHAPDHELGAKSLDYSPATIHDRAAAGRHDMAQALAELASRAPSAEPFVYLPIDPT